MAACPATGASRQVRAASHIADSASAAEGSAARDDYEQPVNATIDECAWRREIANDGRARIRRQNMEFRDDVFVFE
jgi:hypothetical protein